MKRIILILICFIISTLTASDVLLTEQEVNWLKEHPVITLGVDKYYRPLNFENRFGNMDGMNVDFVRLIGKKLGVTFVLDSGAWSDVLPKALDYTNYGIINADESSDKEGLLRFTESFIHHPLGVFTRKEFKIVDSVSKLNTMTLAIKAKTSTIDYVRENFHKAKIIAVAENEDALQLVAEGKADGAIDFYSVLDAIVKRDNLRTLHANKIFYADNIGMSRIGIRKDAGPLISAINKAIISIHTKERSTIISHWIDNKTILKTMKSRISLSDKEKLWLLSHPQIRVGYLDDWAPLQYFDVNGSPNGLISEYISYMDSLLPIDFVVVSLPETMSERMSEIDMVPALSITKEREKLLQFTDTYLELPVYIFATGDHSYVGSLDSYKGKKIALRKEFAIKDWISENYPSITVVPVTSTLEGLQKVIEKDVDAYIGNPFVTGYAISQNHLYSIHVVGETGFSYRLSMGVRKDLAPLVSILNKALNNIDPVRKEAFFRKHMHFVHEKKANITLFLQVGGALLLLLILVSYWNRRLAGEVEHRKKRELDLQRSVNLLTASEQKFKMFFDSIEDAIFIHNMQGRFQEVNEVACKRLGYTREELLNMTIKDIDKPVEDFDPKAAFELLMKEHSLLFEGCHLTKTGEPIPVEINSKLFNFKHENAVISIARDLRERKHKEEELAEYSEKLSIALESTNAGIWTYDLVNSSLEWDDRMYELYGIERDTFSTASEAWENLLHPEDLDRGRQEIQDAIDGVRDFNTRFRVIQPSGEIKFIEAHALVKRDKDNMPLVMVGVNFDVTEKTIQEQMIISSEKSLREAKERAEYALRAKSDFLANMSHEIRTPLNAVTGFSELLEGMVTDPKQRSYLTSIKMAGKTLLRLINDVLDLSKMEAGRMKVQFEHFSLKLLFSEMNQIFTLKAEEKKLKLTFDCDESIGYIKLDEIRCRQILLNLIGNALKFTQEGCIEVAARMKKLNGSGELRITVKDSGIGIPESDQERIFEDFQQQEEHNTKQFGGTGLGLAISKRLVEMQGGTISVESTHGEGATFTLTFPNVEWRDILVDTIETSEHHSNVYSFKESMVWIADDVASNLILLQELLLQVGLLCETFDSGAKMLDALDERTPELIITDIRMPEMSGVELSQRIAKEKELSIPVIALTASSNEEDLQLEENYFSGYLRKPVEIEELYSKIAEFLPQNKIEISSKAESRLLISPGFREYLDKEIGPQLEQLQGAMVIDEVRKLGEAFLQKAEKEGSEVVIRFARQIIEAADSFDIKTISELPLAFKNLLNSENK